MKEGKLSFEDLFGFNMTVRYVDGIVEPNCAIGQHTHEECEIYIHLDGDVSFMVEDCLYPVQYGNVVLTRPYEYHHCIYHKTTEHRHFWILFSGDGNEKLLDLFFRREKGEGNLLRLSGEKMLELIKICETLSGSVTSSVERYCCFFKMLELLEHAEVIGKERGGYCSDIASVLETVQRNFSDRLTVKMLADEAHVSVSTLERWFGENLGMTPTAYVKKVRLECAARLLREQNSVTEAAGKSGFSDVSAMIALFKKQYGVTPLSYKKRHRS